jgi:hypothetical protein
MAGGNFASPVGTFSAAGANSHLNAGHPNFG